MAIERILNSSVADEDDQEIELELTLRPKDFVNYVGQDRIKTNLKLAIRRRQKARRTD